MSLFGPVDQTPPELTEAQVSAALAVVKADARNRRIAMFAPMALAVAIVSAFVAGPSKHGGLDLVPEANARPEVPRVFGANGVWRFAEPIGEPAPTIQGAPWVVEFQAEPDSPDFVLSPPEEPGDSSFPASTSSPPASTLEQYDPHLSDRLDLDGVDWSRFTLAIRVDAPATTDDALLAPASSAPAEAASSPTSSSADEDVTGEVPSTPEPTGDAATSSEVVAADTANQPEAIPSTPQVDLVDPETRPASTVATIVSRSVLVHSAHVSVTVQVVDDDSSVIDWCNTRVDWGDGSVTGWVDPDGIAACTAPCEQVASPSGIGINSEITFSHEYTIVIDAAPRVFVATGDGCNYDLAELQLSPFTVVPY